MSDKWPRNPPFLAYMLAYACFGAYSGATFAPNVEWVTVAVMLGTMVPGWLCSLMLHRRHL
jgi:hypothetical protein